MNSKDYVDFEAIYDDGNVEDFAIDADTLRNGDHVARHIARERQEKGELPRGVILNVRRSGLSFSN